MMEEDTPGFVPFSGGGQRLNGSSTPANLPDRSASPNPRSSSPKVASPSPSPSSSFGYGPGSLGKSPSGSLGRSASPFSFNPNNSAPLAVPAGKLVFGKVSSPVSSPSSSFLTSSIKGNQPQGSPSDKSGYVAFSGEGRSLK